MDADTGDLFAEYPDHPGWKTRETSAAAAEKMAPVAGTLRGRCFDILAASEGLTADEVATRLGASILSVRPRISELARLGSIQDSGERRKNSSTVRAIVWRVVRLEAYACAI